MKQNNTKILNIFKRRTSLACDISRLRGSICEETLKLIWDRKDGKSILLVNRP